MVCSLWFVVIGRIDFSYLVNSLLPIFFCARRSSIHWTSLASHYVHRSVILIIKVGRVHTRFNFLIVEERKPLRLNSLIKGTFRCCNDTCKMLNRLPSAYRLQDRIRQRRTGEGSRRNLVPDLERIARTNVQWNYESWKPRIIFILPRIQHEPTICFLLYFLF